MTEPYEAARRYAHDALVEYDGHVAEGLYPPLAGIQRKCIEDCLALAWLVGGDHAYRMAIALGGGVPPPDSTAVPR